MRKLVILCVFLPASANARDPTRAELKSQIQGLQAKFEDSFSGGNLVLLHSLDRQYCLTERGIRENDAEAAYAKTAKALHDALVDAEQPVLASYVAKRFPKVPVATRTACNDSSPALSAENTHKFQNSVTAFSAMIANTTSTDSVDIAVDSDPDGASFALVPGDAAYSRTGTSNSTLHNVSIGEYNVKVTLDGYQPAALQLDLVSDPTRYKVNCRLTKIGEKPASKCTAGRQ